MKRIVLVTVILVSVGLTSGCVRKSNSLTRNSIEADKRVPRITLASSRELSKGDEIVSITLKDNGNLFSVQHTKSAIVHFGFTPGGELRVNGRFEPAENWLLGDIVFTGSTVGFAIGDYGTVLKTENGGLSWYKVPKFTNYDLNRVAFLNESIGYVAGYERRINQKTDALETKIEIWRTDDGGRSWKRCYKSDKENEVFRMVALTPDIALALIAGQRLIRTTDGGKSWKDVFVAGRLGDFTFSANGTGWLIGDGVNLLKSEDSGETWKKVGGFPAKLQGYHWSGISMGETGNGLAVSQDGIFAYSLDYGNTWEAYPKEFKWPPFQVWVYRDVGVILDSISVYKVDFGMSSDSKGN